MIIIFPKVPKIFQKWTKKMSKIQNLFDFWEKTCQKRVVTEMLIIKKYETNICYDKLFCD